MIFDLWPPRRVQRASPPPISASIRPTPGIDSAAGAPALRRNSSTIRARSRSARRAAWAIALLGLAAYFTLAALLGRAEVPGSTTVRLPAGIYHVVALGKDLTEDRSGSRRGTDVGRRPFVEPAVAIGAPVQGLKR